MSQRRIAEGKQGCFGKTKSWFDDERVKLTVREYISGVGESNNPSNQVICKYITRKEANLCDIELTAEALSKAVGQYLDSI